MSCNRFLIDGALCKMWRICKSNQRFQTLSFSPSTLIVFENLHFQWRFQRFTVDGRRKRIEKYVFSNENALVWTGPKAFWGKMVWLALETPRSSTNSTNWALESLAVHITSLFSKTGTRQCTRAVWSIFADISIYPVHWCTNWSQWNFRLFVS